MALIITDSWTVADPGGAEGAMAPPGPVKIGHKKDGRQRQPHRFHVSRPPLPGRWIRYCNPKINSHVGNPYLMLKCSNVVQITLL